jgi:hypothetical protein
MNEIKTQSVWRVTLPNGETCHFGQQSTATAWARETGYVEEVQLTPRDFRIVVGSADSAQDDEQDLTIVYMKGFADGKRASNLQAGEPVGELIASDMAIALHYPEHWDTAAYPTVMDALAEVIAYFQCSSEDHQAEAQQSKPDWQRITKPGSVKIGDKLRFTIGDDKYSETAKLILNAGTDKEEIIYNRRKNYYLITSMAIENKGSQKNVEFLAQQSKGESK